MYGTFLIAFYERTILRGQEVITMSKQLHGNVTFIDGSPKLALVVREMDSAFHWIDHYAAYKSYQNQLSHA